MDRKAVARRLLRIARELVQERTAFNPMNPLASAVADDVDKAEAYTAEVAKLVRKKKGELGISSFRQNYKGKGSQRAIRQIWMRFKNGAVIDVWIHPGGVKYGGVVSIHPTGVRRGPDPSARKTTDNAKKTADTIADDLKEWMEG